MKKTTRILAAALAAMLLLLAMPFSVFAAEAYEISEFDYGYWGPADTPLLVILVNADPSLDGLSYEDGEVFLQHKDHSYWSNMFFGDGPKTMKSYFEIQSGGNFRFIPAEENFSDFRKNNEANDGIVEVTVTTAISKGTKGSTSDPERYAALAACVENGYVDFSVYDKNGDKRVTEDELMVAFITAGYEYTRSTSTPSYNAHMSSFNYGFGGIQVSTDYVKCGEMINNDTPLTVGSFCHELGHALGNGDLYAAGATKSWGGANSPAGKVSVMAGNGSSGSNTGESKGESPSNYDPYHLTVYGLYDYTSVGDGTYTLYSRQSGKGEYNILKVSTPNPSEYYLIENRYYDNSSPHFDSETNYDGTRGILIWHVDQGLADAGRAGAGMRINSGGVNADIGVAALAPVVPSVADGGEPRNPASSGVFNKAGLVFDCHDYKFPGSETWNTSLTSEQEEGFNLQIEILDDPGHEIKIKITGAPTDVSPRYDQVITSTETTMAIAGKITDLNTQTLTSLTLELSTSEDFKDAKSVSIKPNTDGTYDHTFEGLNHSTYYYVRTTLGTKNGDFAETEKVMTTMVKVEDTSKYKVNFYRGLSENDRAYSQTAKVNEALVLKFPMNKTGYVFAGWYTEAEYENFYDVSVPKTEPGDIDLYARWVKAEEAATLTVKGATLVNEKVNGTGAGVVGETFHEPTVVLKEGETVEWYADAAFTTPFDFTKTIESADAVTIYAKIVKAGASSEETSTTLPGTEETTTASSATETTSATENTENTSEDTQKTDSESGMPVGVIVVIVAAVLIAIVAALLVVKKKK
ncbi:MAG: InlB B-repeat-containing protein [Clostridia bacterium]|nr:InlB B-repeat-containing protein [Clostridia bacterium]